MQDCAGSIRGADLDQPRLELEAPRDWRQTLMRMMGVDLAVLIETLLFKLEVGVVVCSVVTVQAVSEHHGS